VSRWFLSDIVASDDCSRCGVNAVMCQVVSTGIDFLVWIDDGRSAREWCMNDKI
jgi:hypothetical protein